ncbi:hypothetical protein CRENBAI_007460 [Crenichthys baileyi]|uniref:Secreted protein n=1 Tax=Crenichthys baileyi TaxID=28760 RepID=A0AAV9S1S4_9TELE
MVVLGRLVCSFVWSGAALLAAWALLAGSLLLEVGSYFGRRTGYRGRGSDVPMPPSSALGKRGCLLGSARELAPWESILPPSPSLPIPGHLPSPAPSRFPVCQMQRIRD